MRYEHVRNARILILHLLETEDMAERWITAELALDRRVVKKAVQELLRDELIARVPVRGRNSKLCKNRVPVRGYPTEQEVHDGQQR